MSMSQEEIEALMSGLDIQEDETPEPEVQEPEPSSKEENSTMSEEDIAELIAETDVPAEKSVQKSSEISVEENIDEIIDSIEDSSESTQSENSENIEDILASIDGMDDKETSSSDKPAVAEVKPEPVEASAPSDPEKEAIAKNWTDNQIDQGLFPFPVEKNTKVVHQLSEVATDSEEKASKIFDVLSFILDENNEIQKDAKALDEFMAKQIIIKRIKTNDLNMTKRIEKKREKN